MYIMLRSKIFKIKYLILYKTTLNGKINEVKGEIPSITNLDPNTAYTVVEKFSEKKLDYNTKINEIEKEITDHVRDKYITTPGFNKLTADKTILLQD